MNIRRKDLALWSFLVLVLGGQILLIVIMITNKATGDQIIGYITGGLIPAVGLVFSLLQRQDIRIYLFIQRIRSLLSGRAPAWHLSANFTGEKITRQTLDEITHRISKLNMGNEVVVRHINSTLYHILVIPGPTFEIGFHQSDVSPLGDSDESYPAYIQVTIRNYNVDYRNASAAIKHKIIPALEEITNVIDKVNAKYSLVIEYNKNENPFFGLYVAHLQPEVISAFSVRLVIDVYEPNDTVNITETKMAINARSQNALQHLALEFLTFDSRLKERLNNA